MGKLTIFKVYGYKCEGAYMLHKGKLYHGEDLIACMCGMMVREGTTFQERYGEDPRDELFLAMDVLDNILYTDGNGVVGIEILRKDEQSYFAVYFKKDVFCYWAIFESFAKQLGHKIAYVMNDELVVPESGRIVVETVEV